jgi:transcriptional regulator with XRE-family HTH domain
MNTTLTIEQRLALLPEKLKILRARTSLTQEAVSTHLQMTTSIWGHYENGRFLPSIETILKICQAFQTTPDWLFSFEE